MITVRPESSYNSDQLISAMRVRGKEREPGTKLCKKSIHFYLGTRSVSIPQQRMDMDKIKKLFKLRRNLIGRNAGVKITRVASTIYS